MRLLSVVKEGRGEGIGDVQSGCGLSYHRRVSIVVLTRQAARDGQATFGDSHTAHSIHSIYDHRPVIHIYVPRTVEREYRLGVVVDLDEIKRRRPRVFTRQMQYIRGIIWSRYLDTKYIRIDRGNHRSHRVYIGITVRVCKIPHTSTGSGCEVTGAAIGTVRVTYI
jgi:hypothetical protein